MTAVEETKRRASIEPVLNSGDWWANQRCMLLPCLKRDSRPCANLFIIAPVIRVRRINNTKEYQFKISSIISFLFLAFHYTP